MKYSADICRRKARRLKNYDYRREGFYFVTICTNSRECFFGDIVKDEVLLNDAGFMIRKMWEILPDRFPYIRLDTFILMPNHLHGIIVIFEEENSADKKKIIGDRMKTGAGDEHKVRPCGGILAEDMGENKIIGNSRHIVGRDEHKVRPYGRILVEDVGENKMIGDKMENGVGDEHKVRPYGARGTKKGTIGRIIQAFKSITTVEYIKGVEYKNWPSFEKKLWQRNYYDRIIRSDEELCRIREYILNNPLKWEFDRNNPEIFKKTLKNK